MMQPSLTLTLSFKLPSVVIPLPLPRPAIRLLTLLAQNMNAEDHTTSMSRRARLLGIPHQLKPSLARAPFKREAHRYMHICIKRKMHRYVHFLYHEEVMHSDPLLCLKCKRWGFRPLPSFISQHCLLTRHLCLHPKHNQDVTCIWMQAQISHSLARRRLTLPHPCGLLVLGSPRRLRLDSCFPCAIGSPRRLPPTSTSPASSVSLQDRLPHFPLNFYFPCVIGLPRRLPLTSAFPASSVSPRDHLPLWSPVAQVRCTLLMHGRRSFWFFSMVCSVCSLQTSNSMTLPSGTSSRISQHRRARKARCMAS